MTTATNLSQRPLSAPPDPGIPTRCGEPPLPNVTPAQVHAVLRDIIRRDPGLWSRVQRDHSLWQAFGFETEGEDTESPTAAAAVG